MKNSDFDKEIRHLIEVETQLVNGRMNWLILSQALLFAGYCAIYEHNTGSSILTIISILGILLSIVVRHSFWMNEKAIAFILHKWNEYISKNNFDYKDFPPVWAGEVGSVILSRRDKIWRFFSPVLLHHIAIPYLFALAWSSILICNIL